MMVSFITAQLIGTAGYLLYILSPHFKKRAHILQTEILAYLVLALQWALLGQTILIISNMLAMMAAMIGILGISRQTRTVLLGGLFPLAVMVFIMSWENSMIHIIAGIGTLLMISSKVAADITRFRLLAGLSGAFLSVSAVLASCAPAVFFNLLFAAGHIHKIAPVYKRVSPATTA